MDLEFTPDQEELRTSVRAVLGRECPPSLVRELVEKGTQADDLWTAMVELDWPALTIDTAHGGLGLGFVELAVVVEELGRAIAPGPFLPTVTQFVPAIREAGTPEQQDRYDNIMAIYAAVVERIDKAVGTFVEGLKKRGVLDELFKALLHKLMTGEIRVADLDLPALASARVAEAAQ